MRYIILLIVLAISSCAYEPTPENVFNDITELTGTDKIVLRINFKKYKWTYEPYQYDHTIKCGYVNDKWLYGITPNHTCIYDCIKQSIGTVKQYVYADKTTCLNDES